VELERLADIVELEQLLARYASAMTRHDIDAAIGVFTADGTYSAFGETYTMAEFRRLTDDAPHGLYSLNTPALELDGDAGTGVQPLCFVSQTDHSMRIGYYTDTYRRTQEGWRIAARAMTFLRRSGARDSGRPHSSTSTS
jgi:hypothetical protein